MHHHRNIACNRPSELKRQETKLQEATAAACTKRQVPRLEYYSSPDGILNALQNNDVGLVRGTWLIELARGKGILGKRQELPPEAFWNPKDLFQPDGSMKRTVIAVSHAWLTPVHPDPDGRRVAIVGEALYLLMSVFSDPAIYWDWCSLYQDPRSIDEQIHFSRSLPEVGLWYMHSRIVKLLFTSEPSDFEGPSYAIRGWTTFERQVSSLISQPRNVLDLSNFGPACQDYKSLVIECSKTSLPPASPNVFKTMLEEKFWTTQSDCQLLVRVYQELFMSWISGTKELSFQDYCYGDDQVDILAGAIRHCARLQCLDLSGNVITSDGAAKLAHAIPRCRRLINLDLQGNRIGIHGEELLREAWRQSKRPDDGLRVRGVEKDDQTKGSPRAVEKAEALKGDFYYEGMYKHSQRHGHGTLWNQRTGFCYEGNFSADLFDGHGDATWQDGSKYSGQWEEGQKQGQGEFTSNDGLRYVGSWERGQRHGDGMQEYSDGGRYEGSWVNGLCSGRGTYIFADGSRYNGGWYKGRHNGAGTMENLDGTRERLNYKNGLLMSREVLNTSALPLVMCSNGNTAVSCIAKSTVRQWRDDVHKPVQLPSLSTQRLIGRESHSINLSVPPLRPRSASRSRASCPELEEKTPRLPLTCR